MMTAYLILYNLLQTMKINYLLCQAKKRYFAPDS